MATNPWESDPVIGELAPPPGMGGPRYGPPPKPKDQPAPRAPQAVPGAPGYFLNEDGEAFRPEGLPADVGNKDGTVDAAAKARVDALTAFTAAQAMKARLAEMRENFKAGPGATKGLAGVRDWLPGPEQEAFDAAANSVRGQVGSLLGFTGGQLNAVAEAAMAVGPYIPTSRNFDNTAIDKMNRLANLARDAESRSIAILGGIPDENGNITPVPAGYEPPPADVWDGRGPPGGSGGDGGTPEGPQFTPEQEAELKAFLRRVGKGNLTPEAFDAKIRALTGKGASNAETWVEKFNAGAPANTGIVYKGGEPAEAEPQSDIRVTKPRDGVAGDLDALGMGVADTLTLGTADEISAFGNAMRRTEGSFGDAYNQGLDAYRGTRDMAAEESPWAYGGGQVAGGLVLPGAGARTAMQFARLGAGYGGAYGAGNAEGGFGNRAAGGVEGAALGSALSYGVARAAPAVGNALAGLVARRSGRGMAPELAQAADAEGIDMYRAMVDPRARSRTAALESDQIGQPIIRRGVARTQDQIEARAGQLAGDGTAVGPEAAGTSVQRAGRRFIEQSRGVADRLYNRARNLAGDTRIQPTNALRQVDDELSDLAQNPRTTSGEREFLEDIQSDLAEAGGKTTEGLRSLRQSLRGRIAEKGLTATPAEARAMRILDAAQTDAAASLPPGAASAFRRADLYYRERMVHIDDVLESVVGGSRQTGLPRLSGEQAFNKIKSLAAPGGDGRRLAALMRRLEPNERQDVAATIAATIGREADDLPFSAARFISQTSKLSESGRRTIFGPEGAESIRNLRRVSQALKDAGGDINFSRTTTTSNFAPMKSAAMRFLGAATGLGSAGYVGAGAGGAAAMVGVTGAAIAGGTIKKALSARALVNPDTSRWLAQVANVRTVAQANAALDRLGTIINRQPALAGELTPIHQYLTQALRPALASDETQPE